MKELPRAEIEWIARLRSEGNSWEYIAEEWDMPRMSLIRVIRRSGYDPDLLGMPALPTISPRELKDDPGQIGSTHMIPRRGKEPLIVMPLSEYLNPIGREEV